MSAGGSGSTPLVHRAAGEGGEVGDAGSEGDAPHSPERTAQFDGKHGAVRAYTECVQIKVTSVGEKSHKRDHTQWFCLQWLSFVIALSCEEETWVVRMTHTPD